METDFLDIVTDILQGDTLASYLFICIEDVLHTSIDLMKEKWLYMKKIKKSTILRRNYDGLFLPNWYKSFGLS